jgi:hemerythrin-like metal-binding protein
MSKILQLSSRMRTDLPEPTPGAPIAWHDGLLLGHPPMDDEHEALVAAIAALQAAPDAELPALLGAFAAQAQAHFDAEDGWMRASAFPPAGCHIGEHAAVLGSVKGVQKRLAAGDTAAARTLARALADWFPSHAMHLDSALAHWLNKQRLGGKPVVLRRHLAPTALPAQVTAV